MDSLSISIILFSVLELSNVLSLYFKPDTQKANAMGMFKQFINLKDEDEHKDLIYYLVNWVAGTKLIFISLLIMLALYADQTLKALTLIVLIVSILSYFWRLSPLMKKMDAKNQITPKGYSKKLDLMIGSFVFVFIAVLFHYYFF